MIKSIYLTPFQKDIEQDKVNSFFCSLLQQEYKKIALFCPVLNTENHLDIECFYSFKSKEEAEKLFAHNESLFFEKIIESYCKIYDKFDFILINGFFEEEFNFFLDDINFSIAKDLSAPIVVLEKSDDLDILDIIHHKITESHNMHLATLLMQKNSPKSKVPYPLFSIAQEEAKAYFKKSFKSVAFYTLTPLRFRYKLFQRAKKQKRIIALTELDERVLKAADFVLKQDVAAILFVGEKEAYLKMVQNLSLDLSKAQFIEKREYLKLQKELAIDFYELRREKGISKEQAKEIIAENSTYFATMLVYKGYADGLVCGATHTTADTVRPALQILKTKKDFFVSSIFLMSMDTKVLIFGDCAINRNPNPKELARIAIDACENVLKFGILPRVAMLSYSSGNSGSGEDVEKVRKAVEIVKKEHPDILIDGPMQYDAAVDIEVAKRKLPNSKVAGRATVFIFPDLDTGNITYKAVQRSSGAVAIGPILQGLAKPVNDLSRGATVDDIINTIAVTAIQAQERE